jgi:ribose transport system substrate-binding protein
MQRRKKVTNLAAAAAVLLTLALAACGAGAATSNSKLSSSQAKAAAAILASSKAAVAAATSPVTAWDGPTTGPKAQKNKFVVYVSEDQNNAGAAGVGAGVEQAAKEIGWKFKLIDAGGTVEGETSAMNQAIALKPDGIVIGAIDVSLVSKQLAECKQLGIPVVGWHSASNPGPVQSPPLFTNVQSNLADSATLLTQYVIATTGAKAQVVIMTWNLYAASIEKADAMRTEIKKCVTCKLLSFDNSPLTTASTRMPTYTASLAQRFRGKLTDVMMFNDGFADYMAPALRSLGIPSSGSGSISLVSAGDGSNTAYNRIRSGEYQTATIPEPLNEHGWQIVDDLNRAFAGDPPSTYVTPLHLIVKSDVNLDGGSKDVFDPNNNYEGHYKAIWGVG